LDLAIIFLALDDVIRSPLGPAALDSVIRFNAWSTVPATAPVFDDYGYEEKTRTAVSHSVLNKLLLQYLVDTSTHLWLHTLHKYDAVKRMILHYKLMQSLPFPHRWSVCL